MEAMADNQRASTPEELRQLIKTDPDLRRAYINAKDIRLPEDEHRPSPKERYNLWVKETLSSLPE